MSDVDLRARVRAWQDARRALLDNIEQRDDWLAKTKKGIEAVEPTPLMEFWSALGTAEADLFKVDLDDVADIRPLHSIPAELGNRVVGICEQDIVFGSGGWKSTGDVEFIGWRPCDTDEVP